MTQFILYARKSQEDEGRQQQSIPDQVRTMQEIADRQGLVIERVLTEERSAKEPYQRPVFDDMIATVQRGEVRRILCYHANRLARNMVEGGLLQHLLTKGVIQEIRTYNEVFRSGDNILPFVLQAAMSTQYSLDLSQHVRRGMQSKIEKGDWPHLAPAGYVNNLYEHTIDADPERFALLRRAWDRVLSGGCSLEAIAVEMNTEWGYRSRRTRRGGGKPMGRSELHRIFHSEFYTGHFRRDGELFQGNHPAMVTMEEFDAVQRILGRLGSGRPHTREFAYRGLVVCGHCGRQVTAEHQGGRWERGDFIYYRCSNSRVCKSKAVRQEVLEKAIDAGLRSVAIQPTLRDAAIQVIERIYAEESASEQTLLESQHRALEDAQRRMTRLIRMSLDELLSDMEFKQQKATLQAEISGLTAGAARSTHLMQNAREGALEVANFVTAAPHEFLCGTLQVKREIARKLGITYRLRDGQLETELHPLLAPLCDRAIEPRIPGSESPKSDSLESPVPAGCTGGTLFEPLREVWDLLVGGAPRLYYPVRQNGKKVLLSSISTTPPHYGYRFGSNRHSKSTPVKQNPSE